jgi:hypothetical protein
MEATKDHISLETAKLLNDCGVESKYAYGDCVGKWGIYSHPSIDNRHHPDLYKYGSPAYTWQEILWGYPKEFFGDKFLGEANMNGTTFNQFTWSFYPETILSLLQQKNYKEADLYFRENCILINK